jgi:hypothetical protein
MSANIYFCSFESIAQVHSNYFLCDLGTQKELARVIDFVPLSLEDRFTLIHAPVRSNCKTNQSAFIELARVRGIQTYKGSKPIGSKTMNIILKQRSFSPLDLTVFRLPSDPSLITSLLSQPSEKVSSFLESWFPIPKTQLILTRYEALHQVTSLYMWLHYRFPDTFARLDIAHQLKAHFEGMITLGLEKVGRVPSLPTSNEWTSETLVYEKKSSKLAEEKWSEIFDLIDSKKS